MFVMVKKRGVETRFPSVGFAISCIDQGTHWYLLCGLFAHAFVKKRDRGCVCTRCVQPDLSHRTSFLRNNCCLVSEKKIDQQRSSACQEVLLHTAPEKFTRAPGDVTSAIVHSPWPGPSFSTLCRVRFSISSPTID